MDIKMHLNKFLNLAGIVTALFAGIILIPELRAQPTEQTVQSRFLFVFETSHDMKLRLEATEKALNIALALSLNGQMHAGDSMGVWTFGQKLRPGDYPLQTWDPDNAVAIASNLVKFVDSQQYAKSARFEALQPVLNEVVQDSERLTVLIFCDGGGKFSGTPYDDGINQIFEQKSEAQKKTKQPFIIVLRSQLGQYIGCTVGLPPELLTYPQFPPLPAPPPPAPKVTNTPAPAPVIVGQPLIIIGTKNKSNPPAPVAVPTNSPAMTNPPPVVLPPVIPNPPPNAATVPPANLFATNLAGQAAPPTNVAATTGMPAPRQLNSNTNNKRLIIVGAVLLVAASAMGIVIWLRSRQKDKSLITDSMNDPK
jgi:hypothetical protein